MMAKDGLTCVVLHVTRCRRHVEELFSFGSVVLVGRFEALLVENNYSTV